MIFFCAKLAGIIIPMQILLVRSVSLLSLAPFISWDRDSSYNRLDLAANILYGFCDAVGISLTRVAMTIMSTSDASALLFNVPFTRGIRGMDIARRKVRLIRWRSCSNQFCWPDFDL